MIVAKCKKYSSLYVMQTKIVDLKINNVDDEGIVKLCHNRLSHISEKGLMILVKKNLLSGLENGSLKSCADWLSRK